MVISNSTFEMFNFFLERLCPCSYLFSRFFEKQMVNFRISYFRYSHLTCSSLRSSLSNILIVNKICSSIFSTYFLFNNKDFLNFHKPFREKIHSSDLMKKELVNDMWQKKLKYHFFFTRSCRISDTKK